jgi:putative transposase
MAQVARNVTDSHDGFLRGKRYPNMDRDTKPSDAFGALERFVRSIKEECLNRMIFANQASLRHAIDQYLTHYHIERNHQGLGNQLLISSVGVDEFCVAVKRRARLGGMLSYYHREAA